MIAKNKKGLGRGLSALFGDESNISSQKKNNINKVLIADIGRNRFQPRVHFDEEKLEELSNSIKKNGLIQPIAVRIDKTKSNK